MHNHHLKQPQTKSFLHIHGEASVQENMDIILNEIKQTSLGIIAIDGRSASGKTTLAKSLAEHLSAGLVHMDDFFLPQHLRTASRLNEVGGNVDYDRFIKDVLPHCRCTPQGHFGAFAYPIFDCSHMKISGTRHVTSSPWLIIEGAYAAHPKFGNYMDFNIFSDIDPKLQMARIIQRNGKEKAAMFAARWIPYEEQYISWLLPEA